MNKSKKIFSGMWHNALLILLAVMMLLPFTWIFSTSLRLPKDSFKFPPNFLPTSFHFENYTTVFQTFPFLNFIFNSLFVGIVAGIFNIIVTTMAAFAFARIRFKGRGPLFVIFLAGLMIPMQATIIPTFIIMSKVKLVGTLWALIIPAMITPLSIFLVRQFMMTIPKSYEEAAYMDGANRFLIYLKIILPMSKSVIIMTSLINFLFNWNNFMGPLIYLSDWEKMTIPIGLRMLQGYQGTGSISVIFAGVFMSIVPALLLYLFGQKYLVKGAAISGLKS